MEMIRHEEHEPAMPEAFLVMMGGGSKDGIAKASAAFLRTFMAILLKIPFFQVGWNFVSSGWHSWQGIVVPLVIDAKKGKLRILGGGSKERGKEKGGVGGAGVSAKNRGEKIPNGRGGGGKKFF